MPIQEATTSLRDDLAQAFAEHIQPDEPAVEQEPAAVTETAAPPASPAKAVEDKTGRLHRPEDGKFAPKKAEEPKAPETPAQRPPRPQAWKKDYEKDWETLPPHLAAYINQREQEYQNGVSTYKKEWERAKDLMEAVAPYAQQFQQYGVQPAQWIRSLGAAHQALALGSPQQKLQTFQKLAQDYGVPLQALLPQRGPDGQLQQPQINPMVAWMQQQVGNLRGEMQQWRSQQEQAQAAQIEKEIESFASADHPHYEALKQTMADVLEKGFATTLGDAYNIAMRMPQHDDILTAVMDERRKTEETQKAQAAQQVAAKARGKAVSLKSSSPGNVSRSSEDKSLREQLAENLEAAGSRI